MNNWHDLSYLLTGTPRQRSAWEAIHQLQLMDLLRDYRPLLAGTIPLNIDVEQSDLDIICESDDLDRFDRDVRTLFGTADGYKELRMTVHRMPTSVINFWSAGFWFELFAQPVPVEKQNAYRHMDLEARLLALGGSSAYREIRLLKQQGMKTEPAFARYFNIPGDDPYQALLDWERLTDDELRLQLHIKTS